MVTLISASPERESFKHNHEDAETLAEFDAIVDMLKENFLGNTTYGYGSVTFQKILKEDTQRDQHAANSKKVREERILEFLNRRNQELVTIKNSQNAD